MSKLKNSTFGHLDARMVSSVLKAVRPKPAWSEVRENLWERSWDPNTIIIESSDIRLARGLDLKKAKWLKAAEPLLTVTFLLASSCSNSPTQVTSSWPTLAAWFSVYVSNSSGDLEPSGNEARCRSSVF